MTSHPVIYLTGAPATGKSTLARNMLAKVPELLVFAYSEELRKFVKKKNGQQLTEDKIRELSAVVITAEDVAELDRELVRLVAEQRHARPILVDSHPVTKESYGFRVTSFDVETLRALNPDVIVCLYTASDVSVQRITANPMGRPLISNFEASMHTHLQTSVAAQYGVLMGKPIYFVNSHCSPDELVTILLQKAKLAARNG